MQHQRSRLPRYFTTEAVQQPNDSQDLPSIYFLNDLSSQHPRPPRYTSRYSKKVLPEVGEDGLCLLPAANPSQGMRLFPRHETSHTHVIYDSTYCCMLNQSQLQMCNINVQDPQGTSLLKPSNSQTTLKTFQQFII
ncbi:unnamed protein product [Closterium sp. Yama58-4]|nr:unnamed protein product [Closterium sp. Yama58-4]